MGKFTYQTDQQIDIEDRALAHLQVVISNKLRRSETFFFTWTDASSNKSSARLSVWMSPSVPMSFRYYGKRAPTLNRAWIEALAVTANQAGGLYLVPEPPEQAHSNDLSAL